ncbi:NAD(P)/FAD-dependent oxidoreductase [Actinomadura oligospora]|uniref:NAD(P)/FAD-dependent oxidoreductase n=1 Tax=Actinomadura oligospora TaxID=111804 RepID=UPI001FDEACA3|nr:FAD-dependent monooxygenase [Actinomadura oligospora]
MIVVGARCAGAVTAMLLARAGRKVLLLDRAPFPSDTVSTHYVHQPGLAHLHRWGLLDELLATGCPTLTRVSLSVSDAHLTGPAPSLGAVAGGCAPRRHILDHILVRAAVRAGAEFRPRTTVLDLHWQDGVVAGIVHGTRHGTQHVERAPLVIGADGRHSTVARLARAPYLHQDPELTRTYYAYWSGLANQGLRFYLTRGAGTACMPTHDGLTVIPVAFSRTGHPIANSDRQRTYLGTLGQTSLDLERQLADARQEGPLFCCSDQPNFFRRAHGPGWALVGDAAHTKDPCWARGITDAFTQASMLADSLDMPLADHRRVGKALTDYARRLVHDFTPAYEGTLFAARMDNDRRSRELADNQHDPAYVQRCFRGFAGIPEPAPAQA